MVTQYDKHRNIAMSNGFIHQRSFSFLKKKVRLSMNGDRLSFSYTGEWLTETYTVIANRDGSFHEARDLLYELLGLLGSDFLPPIAIL